MKEEKKTNKKMLYYVLIAVSVLLLSAAIVLTVYFTTSVPSDFAGTTDDNQASQTPDNPDTPDTPDNPDNPDTPDHPDGSEDQPTGGETAPYVMPVSASQCTVEYNAIYSNAAIGMYYRHSGVDFAAEEGAEVYAMADGVVTDISLSEQLGNLVTVTHDGGLVTTYRFVEPLETLSVGDSVKKGEVIARVAKAYGTEMHDGTHLHFEVKKDGVQTDPAAYLEIVYEEK